MISTEDCSNEFIARITEESVARTLVKTIGRLCNLYPIKSIIIAGGVASNKRIRKIIAINLSDKALFFLQMNLPVITVLVLLF